MKTKKIISQFKHAIKNLDAIKGGTEQEKDTTTTTTPKHQKAVLDFPKG